MDIANNTPENAANIQLMMLSLGGVTERFGIAGLGKRFSLEIDNFPIEEQYFCNKALYVASFLHHRDTYKGLPYVSHLMRTSLRLIRDYGVADPEVISAMLLHDSVEDHSKEIVLYGSTKQIMGQTMSEQALGVLGLTFSVRTANLVKNVTNEPTIGSPSMLEKHEAYQVAVADKIARLPETFLMKLSDFTDNTVGILWGERTDKMQRLATKYLPVFDTFLLQLEKYEQAGTLTEAQITIARRQLLTGADRCRALAA